MGTRGRGYSLIELVLVLLIIGTLAAVAVPRYGSALARYRAESAARRVAVDLELARSLARTASKDQVVRFTAATHRYELVGYKHPDRPADPYVVAVSDPPYEAGIASVTIPGGTTDLVFNPFGVPGVGTGAGFAALTSNATVAVRSGSSVYTVTVEAGNGRVRWQ